MKIIFLISIILFILDIISKRIILGLLNFGDSIKVISDFFSITLVKNDGVAFSMMSGYVSLVVIVTLIIIYFLFYSVKNSKMSMLESIGYGMVIGGAFGNLFDRIIYGYVIDFLDFNIFGFDYPVFNLADVFIVLGIILIIFLSFKERGR